MITKSMMLRVPCSTHARDKELIYDFSTKLQGKRTVVKCLTQTLGIPAVPGSNFDPETSYPD